MLVLRLLSLMFLLLDSRALLAKRSLCEPNETCRFMLKGFPVQFCDCPGENAVCPTGRQYGAVILGKRYQFCTPILLEECRPNQVAITIRGGLNEVFHCVCPENTTPQSAKPGRNGRIEYKCKDRKKCTRNDQCAIREHGLSDFGQQISTFRMCCECPQKANCHMQTKSVIVNGNQEEHGYCR